MYFSADLISRLGVRLINCIKALLEEIERDMKVAVLAITDQGKKTAQIIQRKVPDVEYVETLEGVKKTIQSIWHRYDSIICVMAAGIVVRSIARLCYSKLRDPAVVIVDEQGQYAVSLLSGHIGGGNKLARLIASECGAQAVITTGSDVSGHTSIDMWAVENNLRPVNSKALSPVSLRLLNQGYVQVYVEEDFSVELPEDLRPVNTPDCADIIISLSPAATQKALHLMPCCHFIGFGCRRGATVEEFQQVLTDISAQTAIDLRSVAGLGSIDLKNDEVGLLEIANRYNWPISFFTAEELNKVGSENKSEKVYEKVGAFGVCEPAALLASRQNGKLGRLITGKIKWKKITAAVARVAN